MSALSRPSVILIHNYVKMSAKESSVLLKVLKKYNISSKQESADSPTFLLRLA